MAALRHLLAALGLLFACLITPVMAQNGQAIDTDAPAAEAADLPALTPAPIPDEVQAQLDGWERRLDRLVEFFADDDQTLDRLAALREQTIELRQELQGYVDAVEGQVAAESEILGGLIISETGEVVETPEVRAQRQTIVDLQAQGQPGELLLARASALVEQIVSARADLFASQLFRHTDSLIAPQLWAEALPDVPRAIVSIDRQFAISTAAVRNRVTPAAFIGSGVFLVVLVGIALVLRRFALARAQRRSTHEPTEFERPIGAIRIVLLSAGIPAIALGFVLFSLDSLGGVTGRTMSILTAIAVSVTLYFLIAGCARALLAPGLAAWRLVPIEDGYAARATNFIRLAGLSYAVGEVLSNSASVVISPLPVVQLVESVPAAVTAVMVLGATRALLRGLKAEPAPVFGEDEGPALSGILWRWTLPIAAVVAFVVLVAQLLGYLAFGAFLVDRLVWSAVVLAVLHLIVLLVDQLGNAAFQDGSKTSTWVHDNVGLSPNQLGQFGVLVLGIVKLLLILFAGMVIIAPFGVETGAFAEIIGQIFTGIEIGGFTFSLTSVLLALVLVGVGIIITRAVQGWLENRYLPRTGLDAGLKASIRTAVGYVGIFIAAAVGLSYLGLNLENIALVAGALSVGIGFGLQSIVSNFVSGLILLAERPFKPGDWIVVGEEQGIVKRINVRGTEIQTFDRATVLIPNSDFIAGTVKNRVHRDTLGRIDIPVGVSYDSDPVRVKEILLEVANEHPLTLSFPEPAAFFIEFGASSLDFMLFAYLADVGTGYGVRSDIRFEIFRRFKEEGIEIPFTQSDVTIRNFDEVLEALAAGGVAKAEAAGELTQSAPTSVGGVRAVPTPIPQPDPRTDHSASKRIDPSGDGDIDTDDGFEPR